MLNIVLIEPEIPANTGNIGRTCLITGAVLHLVKPFGFSIDDKAIKRAGMDYWSSIDLKIYDSTAHFLTEHGNKRLIMATTKTNRLYSEISYQPGDYLIFGPESRGISADLLKKYEQTNVTIPMKSHPLARSLNLSNAVAVVAYEALRQNNFKGMTQ